ncbi:kynurenine formamidase isoform X2 [Octopus bimaculoides]|uniref:BD-FAE-like domain-containing protein n=1 Tax=Octopus bimaculoides TaxID=37653 RepID=A0A0L8GC40_OCTBM|nr:kynurenine formamidase isoform X2 [Octopus bimaculoides]|eukprot:XP_014782305.1 PREDICTED: kynurenine formamidase-like isoform X2 [Octopus bimaculoides]
MESEKWRSFDLKELERQYSPSQWNHRMTASEVLTSHVEFIKEQSAEAKSCIDCELGIKIGDAERHKLDIFGQKTAAKVAPILVYIHGGYWQLLGRELSSYMVKPIVKMGGIVCPIGYSIAPHGTMEQIVEEVKKSVAYVLKLAKDRGSRGVYVCGHSAGGHLAAMMLTVDWQAEGVDSSLFKGVFPVSGVYDLRPLVQTSVNKPLKMTEESAQQISPAFLTKNIIKFNRNRVIKMFIAEYDSEEFHRQGEEFYNSLKSAGLTISNRVIPDTDHFDVIEKLAEDDYFITKEIIKTMGLTAD